MFNCLEASISDRLSSEGKLTRIDSGGQRVDANAALGPGLDAISVLGPIPLPVRSGGLTHTADWFAFVRHAEFSCVNSVLAFSDRERWRDPLVRIHSSCVTGDIFGSERCECGPQLVSAVDRIAADPQGGMLVYMAGHEGRGIGLWAKAASYLLQDAGENTYQANRSLGLPDDSREFGDAAALLRYLWGNRPFRLLTNNPKKVNDLKLRGLNFVTRVKHVAGVSSNNQDYLSAKRDWGHVFEDDDLVPRETFFDGIGY